MEFDSLVLVRLVRPADWTPLDPTKAARVQDAHLDHVHAMHAANQLIAAGPSIGGTEDVRGFAVMTVDLDTARRLWAEDPGVRAGLFVAELEPWAVPAGMVLPGPTMPPRSVAEVRG